MEKSFEISSEFEGIDFGSKRLEERFVKTMENLSEEPDKSIWLASGSRSEAKAAYRMLSNEKFKDEEDKGVYLEKLQRYREECGFEIYAYCLMNNHIHLLVKENETDLATIMKKIGTSYVYWYNWKYSRSGHLFQDRYKSEPVENERYLLSVLRYIHQNPVKIGLSIEEWTSYQDYMRLESFTDSKRVLEIFDADIKKAHKKYKQFMKETSEEQCLEIMEEKRLTDEEGKQIIKKIIKTDNYEELQIWEKKKRDESLKKLKESRLTVRQIERLTGINRGIILRA